MNRKACVLTGWAALAVIAGLALADAKESFDMLFGADVKRVAATPDTKDDTELAALMLEAVASAGERPELKVLLLAKAAELGAKDASGFETANAAVKQLLELAPARADEWETLLCGVYLKHFQAARGKARIEAAHAYIDQLVKAGDAKLAAFEADEAASFYRKALTLVSGVRSPRREEILGKVKAANAALVAQRRVAGYRLRLQKDPNDAEARRELLLHCLLELDAPAEAERLLTPSVDEYFRTYVPLAAKKAEDVPEAACLELAGWYESLAAKAPAPKAKLTALMRAGTYYQRYLALPEAGDLTRLKAKVALEKVTRAVAALGAKLGPAAVGGRTLILDLPGGVKMDFVLIPAGEFLMGSSAAQQQRLVPSRETKSPEGPRHKVKITKPFYLGKYEVTQAQWQAVMGKNPSKFKDPKNPVETVSWTDAVAFCKKMNVAFKKKGMVFGLPTEAGWEYACRAGTTTAFSFGDNPALLAQHGWTNTNSRGKTHPVGQKKPNAWGLYDMHGNAGEWCSDWYAEDSYSKSPPVDPVGPPTGSRRIYRGGKLYLNPKSCRSAWRTNEQEFLRRVAAAKGWLDGGAGGLGFSTAGGCTERSGGKLRGR